MKYFLSAILFIGFAYRADAVADQSDLSNLKIESQEREHRLNIDFFSEVGQFTRSGVSFQGMGLGAGVRYGLTDATAVGFSMTQTYSTQSNISALYTSLQVDVDYAFYGSFIRRDTTTLIDGQKLLDLSDKQNWRLGLYGGAEQIFFNGTSAVLPGSGVAGGLFADFQLFGLSWTLRGGSYLLIVNGETVPAFTGRLGINFSF